MAYQDKLMFIKPVFYSKLSYFEKKINFYGPLWGNISHIMAQKITKYTIHISTTGPEQYKEVFCTTTKGKVENWYCVNTISHSMDQPALSMSVSTFSEQ